MNQLIDLNPKIASCLIRAPLPFDLLVARLPYSGKPLRENSFANFMVLWLFAKVSPRNWGCGVL